MIITDYNDSAGNTEKFKQFAELASDWFWELDKDLCYIYHSDHHDRFSSEISSLDISGVSRLVDMNRAGVIRNEQWIEHNYCLENQQPLDVVLTISKNSDEERYCHVKAEPLFDKDGVFTGYLGCGHNVTEIYRLQKSLIRASHYDDLSGLMNRRAFHELLLTSLKKAPDENDAVTDGKSTHVLALFALDNFKRINDELGHKAGDGLLVDFCTLLSEKLPSDSLARVGGDEFAVLLSGDPQVLVDQIRSMVSDVGEQTFNWRSRVLKLGVSVGVAINSADLVDPSALLSRADMACQSAKRSGSNTVEIYSDDNLLQRQTRLERSALGTIDDLLDGRELSLYLQPIVAEMHDSRPLQIEKFEVLLRIPDGDGGFVSPAVLIPVAEKYGLMSSLDEIILLQSMAWLERFQNLGSQVMFSVNLSGSTVGSPETAGQITKLITQHSVDASQLCFEVTETAAIGNMQAASEFVKCIHDLGCKFSLDDFGTGLSSFAYLAALDADFLKIDGSFIVDVFESPSKKAIVKSFNTLAHELGMKTVAEFVETDEVGAYLKTLNIDYLQGYGPGKPAPVQYWYEQIVGSLAA